MGIALFIGLISLAMVAFSLFIKLYAWACEELVELVLKVCSWAADKIAERIGGSDIAEEVPPPLNTRTEVEAQDVIEGE